MAVGQHGTVEETLQGIAWDRIGMLQRGKVNSEVMARALLESLQQDNWGQ
jgi:uncharacterized pyridoxal phosphate-containing UPF0001 family protein